MRKIKKVLILFIIFIAVYLSKTVYAQKSYEFENLNIQIQVNENNTYNITEKADVNYNEPCPGFTRVIPLWINGKKVTVNNVDSIYSGYSINKNRQELTVFIGDEDSSITGKREYIYSYTVKAGNIETGKKDYFIYNLTPYSTANNIDKFTFEIKMPKQFNLKDLSVFKKSKDEKKFIPVTILGKTIKGSVNVNLKFDEKIIVYLPLPHGYYKNTKPVQDILQILTPIANSIIAFFILTSIFAFIIVNRKKVKYKKRHTISNNISPCEASFVLDGNINDYDIVSLIIYWLNNGIISIKTETKKDKNGKSNINLEKTYLIKDKNLIGNAPTYQKQILDMLFSFNDENGRIKVSELNKFFNHKMYAIKDMIQKFHMENEQNRLFTKRSLYIKDYIRLAACIPYIYILFKIFYVFTLKGGLALILAAVFSFFFSMFSKFLGNLINIIKHRKQKIITLNSVLKMSVGFFSILLFLIFVYFENVVHTGEYVFAIASGLIIHIFSMLIYKRTDYGQKVFKQTMGLRKFVSEHTLLKIKGKNEQYFYKLLPYCMIFGLTALWFNRYKKENIPLPNWCNDIKPNRTVKSVKKIINYIVKQARLASSSRRI